MLIMLTDPPNKDTDYAGKKAYTLDRKRPDGEKLWKQKSCSFLGLGFLFCFISIRSFTVVKTSQKLFSLTDITF